MAKDFQRHSSRGGRFKRLNFGDLGLRSLKERDQQIIDSLKVQQKRTEEYRDEHAKGMKGVGRNAEDNARILNELDNKLYATKRNAISVRQKREVEHLLGKAAEFELKKNFWEDFTKTGAKKWADLTQGTLIAADEILANMEYEQRMADGTWALWDKGEDFQHRATSDAVKAGNKIKKDDPNSAHFLFGFMGLGRGPLARRWAKQVEENHEVILQEALKDNSVNEKNINQVTYEFLKRIAKDNGISLKTKGFREASTFMDAKATAHGYGIWTDKQLQKSIDSKTSALADMHASYGKPDFKDKFDAAEGIFSVGWSKPKGAEFATRVPAHQRDDPKMWKLAVIQSYVQTYKLDRDQAEELYNQVIDKKFYNPVDLNLITESADKVTQSENTAATNLTKSKQRKAASELETEYEGVKDSQEGVVNLINKIKATPSLMKNPFVQEKFSTLLVYDPKSTINFTTHSQIEDAIENGDHQRASILTLRITDKKERDKYIGRITRLGELTTSGFTKKEKVKEINDRLEGNEKRKFTFGIGTRDASRKEAAEGGYRYWVQQFNTATKVLGPDATLEKLVAYADERVQTAIDNNQGFAWNDGGASDRNVKYYTYTKDISPTEPLGITEIEELISIAPAKENFWKAVYPEGGKEKPGIIADDDLDQAYRAVMEGTQIPVNENVSYISRRLGMSKTDVYTELFRRSKGTDGKPRYQNIELPASDEDIAIHTIEKFIGKTNKFDTNKVKRKKDIDKIAISKCIEFKDNFDVFPHTDWVDPENVISYDDYVYAGVGEQVAPLLFKSSKAFENRFDISSEFKSDGTIQFSEGANQWEIMNNLHKYFPGCWYNPYTNLFEWGELPQATRKELQKLNRQSEEML